MCEPTTATMAAVAIASTAANMYGQQQQANAQKKYQNALAAQNEQLRIQNKANADAAYNNAIMQENEALSAEREKASQQLQDIRIEKMQKQATALASSEGAGMNVRMLMADYERQEARVRDSILFNLEQRESQSKWFRESEKTKYQSAVNSISPYIPQPVAQPNYLGGALKIAGQGLEAYSDWKSTQ